MAARRRIFAVLAVALMLPVAVLSTSAFAGSAPTDAGGGQVWSEIKNADGTTSVSVYTASPGVSTATLLTSLKASGVKGLVDPASRSAVAAADSACQAGTANTFSCPPVRWNKRGFSDPQVYFRDSTTSAWPVSASVAAWHQSPGADSYYIWHASAPCPAASTGKHCVTVRNDPKPVTRDWIGRISWQADANRYFVDGSMQINFNPITSAPTEDYRSAVCKQLGQALGVGRNTADSSCMWLGTKAGPDPRTPNSADFSLIQNRLYPD